MGTPLAPKSSASKTDFHCAPVTFSPASSVLPAQQKQKMRFEFLTMLNAGLQICFVLLRHVFRSFLSVHKIQDLGLKLEFLLRRGGGKKLPKTGQMLWFGV